jgi:hypothetical protein
VDNSWHDELPLRKRDKRIAQLEAALRTCIARAGVPDPLEACRLVIRTAEEALQKSDTKR